MVEKVTLKIFWVMMLLCAASALTFLWAGKGGALFLPEKLIPAFFILGLASLLIWAPLITYRFLAK